MAPSILSRPHHHCAVTHPAGHYDVQPALEPEWQTDPFELSSIDGHLYGRGVSDNKGPVLAFIYAVKELLQEHEAELPVNVAFLIEGEGGKHCRRASTAAPDRSGSGGTCPFPPAVWPALLNARRPVLRPVCRSDHAALRTRPSMPHPAPVQLGPAPPLPMGTTHSPSRPCL